MRERAEPAGVRQRVVEPRQRLAVAFGQDERDTGVVEERGPVDRLGQQLGRSVKGAQRQARGGLRRLVRHRGGGRQHAEHARRDVGLFVGQPPQPGGPPCGIICGLRVKLSRSEGGALERERRAPVGAGEVGAGPVEHLQRLPVAAVDLQHASQREGDGDLSGYLRCRGECRFEMIRRLRVSRIRLGEAELEQDVGAEPPGRRLGQRAPQISDGRVRGAVRDRGLGGRRE